jgi:hypothetical protein
VEPAALPPAPPVDIVPFPSEHAGAPSANNDKANAIEPALRIEHLITSSPAAA